MLVAATRYFVRDDGKWIERLSAGGSEPEATWVLLGPVLILALALQGCWCLHAGAVIRSGSGILFLGESGRGKSTLAARLTEACPQLTRLADDVLPVAMHDKLRGLPPFPQFKLMDSQQYTGFAPVGIDRIYVLRTGSVDKPATRALTASPAALALVQHTLGAGLFPENIMSKHLKFCSQVAQKERLFELGYPHTQASLATVQDIVDRDSCQP